MEKEIGPFFICEQCLIEGGYRLPSEFAAETKRCRCDACEVFDRCWNKDELVPLMGVKERLPKGKSK